MSQPPIWRCERRICEPCWTLLDDRVPCSVESLKACVRACCLPGAIPIESARWCGGIQRRAPTNAPDYPWALSQDDAAQELERLRHSGTVEYARSWAEGFHSRNRLPMPSGEELRTLASLSRHTGSPDVAAELTRIWWGSDVRGVLRPFKRPRS